MSEAGYDGEVCEDCKHWEFHNPNQCSHPDSFDVDSEEGPSAYCDTKACQGFWPSLQCRQVRAEEEANKLREEANRCLRIASSALERIADSLAQAAKWKPTLREDEWVKTVRRPRKPCPECGSEFVEAKFTKLTVPEIGRYGDAAWDWADCVAQCDNCGRNGPEAKGERAALDAWDQEITGDA